LPPTRTNYTLTLQVNPPSDSGFLPFLVQNVEMTQDRTITVVLQLVAGTNDSDLDGIPNDQDNCVGIPNPGQENNDGDQLGDACDPDDDNDGYSDDVETAAGSDPMNELSTPEVCDGIDNDLNDGIDEGFADCIDPDDDNDGIDDGDDNCSLVANPDQADNDDDGIGDACDSDDDNDGVPDGQDNCQFVSNPLQEDPDDNGIGDACEVLEEEAPPFSETLPLPDDEACICTPPMMNNEQDGVLNWFALANGSSMTVTLITQSVNADEQGDMQIDIFEAGNLTPIVSRVQAMPTIPDPSGDIEVSDTFSTTAGTV
jgi:hypothetical protein